MLAVRRYAMLCDAMLRYMSCATLRCATLCYAMLRYATLCYAMLRYATLCYSMLRSKPSYATLCCAGNAMLCCTIIIMLCYATLRYAKLGYAVLAISDTTQRYAKLRKATL